MVKNDNKGTTYSRNNGQCLTKKGAIREAIKHNL